MKAISSGETNPTKGSGNSKGKALHCIKETRVREKEKEMTVLRPLHHHRVAKEVS